MNKWVLFVVVGVLAVTALSAFLLTVPNTRNQLEKRVDEEPWVIADLISDERSLVNVLEGLWGMLIDNAGSSKSRAWAGYTWVSIATNELDLDAHVGMESDSYTKLIDQFLIHKYQASREDPRTSAQAGILLRQRTSPEAMDFVRLQRIPSIFELRLIIESHP